MNDFTTSFKKCLTHRSVRGDDFALREVFLPDRQMKELNTIGKAYYTVFDYVHFRFIYLEESFEKVTGYTPDHLLTGALDFLAAQLHPDDRQPLLKVIKRINQYFIQYPSAAGPPPYVSYCYRLKTRESGYIRLLHEWIRLTRDPQGKLMYCLERCTDISHWQSDNRVTLSIAPSGKQPNIVYTPTEPEKRVVFTVSEKNVIRLLAKGLSSKQIAGELGIAFNTVNTYRRNMLRKSSVKNSTELVQLAYECGIIP